MSPTQPEHSSHLVARMLGPAGHEVSCDRCFAQLDRYVELELVGENAEAALPGMQAHFEGCSACAADHESLRAFLVSQAPGPDASERP